MRFGVSTPCPRHCGALHQNEPSWPFPHARDAGGENDYFEAAIHLLLEKTDVRFLDVSEYPCLEIDFKEDLDSARNLFKT